MYKVIKCFTDMRDEGHVYNAGDTFPREGMTVDQARLDSLASDANRQGTPLIAKVHDSKNGLNSAAPVEPKSVRQETPGGEELEEAEKPAIKAKASAAPKKASAGARKKTEK